MAFDFSHTAHGRGAFFESLNLVQVPQVSGSESTSAFIALQPLPVEPSSTTVPYRDSLLDTSSTRSKFQTFLNRFKLGSAVDKSNCTHHDEMFSYYQVPDNMENFIQICQSVCRSFYESWPMTLSEHVHKDKTERYPLFFDVDCNKHGDEDRLVDPTSFDGLT